jgi:bifunctional N-acetylglucosamine-1-phosphate-uridyltransferase/glucosamine-1-phosphate-acetyltransferase GlmU-like protein
LRAGSGAESVKTSMAELRVLIAAAGAGSRAGLPYPKTLYPVLGRPILIRLLDRFGAIDPEPTVIVSPSGRSAVERCLAEHGARALLVEQPEPSGMGDAVLRFRESPAFPSAKQVLLVWGDIPLIEADTVETLVSTHLRRGNDFTLVTRRVDAAYTVVERDAAGRVTAIAETREAGSEPAPGERDIGLFIFRPAPILDLLEERLSGALGQSTGEHGFLYIVRHLVERGYKVEALPIATERDLVSLNSLTDLTCIDGSGGSGA